MQNYTQLDINRFFEEFKSLPNSYTIEKVHQLINNPYAKATHRMKFKFKPFKIIIMTSALIIGFSAVLLWLNPVNNEKAETVTNQQYVGNEANTNEIKNPVLENINENIPKQSDVKTIDKKKPPIQEKAMDDSLVHDETHDVAKDENSGMLASQKIMLGTPDVDDCIWPSDTVLDKNDMFIKLADKEMEALGVFKEGISYYYNNTTASGNYFQRYNWTKDDIKETHHKFTLSYISDTTCTTHRWGDPFYSQIDTLIPVLNYINDELQVLWFTPHPDIFKALPPRYSYLENVYANLKCLKNKNPEHQLVNYWSVSRNIILDEINYLDLTNNELKNIGVQILEDGINLYDPSNKYIYQLTHRVNNISTASNVGEIPSMFPALITDIKGLKQTVFGGWTNPKNNYKTLNIKDAFETFIPVRLPLSRLISNRDYDLIMWYYPSEEFINALPERIRSKIKGEIEYIKTGISNEEATCTYFEACKSTLSINDLAIYPNPAVEDINIAFSMDEETSGSISLVNISGVEIKTLVPATNFNKGENNFQVNISGVPQGIYLISINTVKGFKTQRIIITQ